MMTPTDHMSSERLYPLLFRTSGAVTWSYAHTKGLNIKYIVWYLNLQASSSSCLWCKILYNCLWIFDYHLTIFKCYDSVFSAYKTLFSVFGVNSVMNFKLISCDNVSVLHTEISRCAYNRSSERLLTNDSGKAKVTQLHLQHAKYTLTLIVWNVFPSIF